MEKKQRFVEWKVQVAPSDFYFRILTQIEATPRPIVGVSPQFYMWLNKLWKKAPRSTEFFDICGC